MANLSTLGMKRKWIYEAILQAGPHFAAMGFWSNDMKTISIKIYHSSKTYRLLEEETNKLLLRLPSSVSDFFLIPAGAKGRKKLLSLPALGLEKISEQRKHDFSIFSFRVLGASGASAKTGLINRVEMLSLECLIDHSRGRDFSEKLRVIRKVAPGSPYAALLGALRRRQRA